MSCTAHDEWDSPWYRLYWTLPLALLICAMTFVWFAYSMTHSAKRMPEPLPVDAELFESPAIAQAPIPQKIIAQPKIKPEVQPDLTPALPKEQATENPVKPSPMVLPPATVAASTTPTTVVAPILTHNAQTVSRPLPVIPDELREEAMSTVATAHFYIAADGSTTVKLAKPTQNPRLNRLLIDALKQWKFSPAMKQGKSIPSEEEIVVRVQVK